MQNYLMIQENIVTNIVVWDGNSQTWQPPSDATMLVKDTTPTKVWSLVDSEFVLINSIGDVDIGFIWDGSVATTNQTKPILPETVVADNQPTSSGTQTL